MIPGCTEDESSESNVLLPTVAVIADMSAVAGRSCPAAEPRPVDSGMDSQPEDPPSTPVRLVGQVGFEPTT